MAIVNPIPPVLSPQDIQRFWSKIDKAPGQGPKGDCWEWTAGKRRGGYGKIQIGSRTTATRRTFVAPRVAYSIITGIWPTLNVLHHCDNPPCVRGEHLFEGTNKENMQDAKAKGRLATGSRNGTNLYPERLLRGDQNGSRKYPERLARGTANTSAKLDDESVKEIRALYEKGDHSHREIGLMYHVGASTIRRAIKHQNWAHLP